VALLEGVVPPISPPRKVLGTPLMDFVIDNMDMTAMGRQRSELAKSIHSNSTSPWILTPKHYWVDFWVVVAVVETCLEWLDWWGDN
jgi:hypothetical protein